jgi:hypothetical protein
VDVNVAVQSTTAEDWSSSSVVRRRLTEILKVTALLDARCATLMARGCRVLRDKGISTIACTFSYFLQDWDYTLAAIRATNALCPTLTLVAHDFGMRRKTIIAERHAQGMASFVDIVSQSHEYVSHWQSVYTTLIPAYPEVFGRTVLVDTSQESGVYNDDLAGVVCRTVEEALT